MTAIGQNLPVPIARRSVSVAHLVVVAVLSGFVMSALLATVSLQAVEIEIQRRLIDIKSETIDLQRGTIDGVGLKFAWGFVAGCGNPCVIRDNNGGVLRDYDLLASLVKLRGQIILIDGYCASACALFADRARAFVRITDRASFWFHQASNNTDPPHSPDIVAWVKANGGFPTQESGELTKMEFADARTFWRPVFDWYREPRRIDAPWHWPNDPIGVRELTNGLPTFIIPSPRSSLAQQVSLRGMIQ